MQTYEIKPVNYEDLRARVEWQMKCLYYKHAVAQQLAYAIAAQMQTKGHITRFLKSDFEERLASAESGEILAGVKKDLGVERTYMSYENEGAGLTGGEEFSFECSWYQTEPFPEGYLPPGSGRQTTRESVYVRRMSRTPDSAEMDRVFSGYRNMDKSRYTLASSLGGLKDACDRFNRALEEIIGASQYGAGTYPLSQAFPFYGNKL